MLKRSSGRSLSSERSTTCFDISIGSPIMLPLTSMMNVISRGVTCSSVGSAGGCIASVRKPGPSSLSRCVMTPNCVSSPATLQRRMKSRFGIESLDARWITRFVELGREIST